MRRRIGTLALVAVSVFVLAAPGWGNVGFDGGRTGNSPTETKITPDAARNLKVRWHVNLGGSTPPVAAGGRVFALVHGSGGGDQVRAYSGADGGCTAPGVCTPLWTVTQPVLANLVYAGGLVRSEGARYPGCGGPPCPGSIDYYGGGFDPATGAFVPGSRGLGDYALPVVDGSCAYGYNAFGVFRAPGPFFLGYSNRLRRIALDSSCTDEYGPESLNPVSDSLTAAHGVLYHTSSQNVAAYRESAITNFLWIGNLSAATGWDDLTTVARGRVFVPTINGDVDVFSAGGCGADSCSPSWIAKAGNVHVGSVAVTDTRLFVASDDGHLYAFRPAGCGAAVCAPTWTANVGTGLHSPSVAGGVVYAGGQNGRVYAFDANGCGAKACSPLGSAATGSPVRWAPVISAGRVYVTNDAGDLFALGGG